MTAACSEGYKGNAKVSRCSEAGEAFTLAGCEPKVCTAPVGDHTEDYDLTQHSVEIPTFNVGVRSAVAVSFAVVGMLVVVLG